MENIKLLIVDDNESNLDILESSLERDELTIFTTALPKTVIQLCLENDISIALIDVKMPDIDGFQLLDLIKADPRTSHIMVILMTGYSMSADDVVKGLTNGAVDYLFKPLDLYITTAKVNSLIILVNYQKEINHKNAELEIYQDELFKAIKDSEEAKALKENFLANMSHEIRTPLNSIIGLTHLLKETALNDDQKGMIRLVEYSSAALLGIVNDILESAKIDAGKVDIIRSETDLPELVKTLSDVTRPLAMEKGLELFCAIEKDIPPSLMADALRIQQILMNIISNAIKFTIDGSISVSLKMVEKKTGSVKLEFCVRDTGIGIPQSSIERIFTRFEQVEDKTWQTFGGTGLGLSIVKRLIELMGGTLHIDSAINKGTTFIFTDWFELSGAAAKSETQPHLKEVSELEELHILLVDDDTTNQFIIVEMLKEYNIRVDLAENGLEALEKLKANDYQLILMDTHMPVMNGYEATRKIRTEIPGPKKDIPIIAFSASVVDKEKSAAVDAGVNDFIEKPYEVNDLVNRIFKMIGRRHPMPE
ncbi:response regulator [Mucilaginibacter corticis]|uniref:histidine kinase n=1 Tax=Mucilaginibacter corticis TaxID=2597670 RepID=A0A556MMH7_9SPHI|nr:response regulator [Mucilaginibacter corticis]TSJ40969.1 response regulator [Mucilaginibacter corticis]